MIKALVNQAFNSLENMTIEDVMPLELSDKESSKKPNTKFDKKIIFSLFNGLVYSVSTSDKYAKISVDFDEEVFAKAKELSSIDNDSNKEYKSDVKDTENSSEKKSVKKEVNLNKSALESSNLETAKRINQAHAKWQYKLPDYAHSKLRKDKKDFFENE